jgi:hypothetical protein
MRKMLKPLLPVGAAGLGLLVAACTTPPPNHKPPPPINNPVDAFEAVGQPQDIFGLPPQGRYNETLSSDVRRLQNAHQAYQQAQARHAAEVQRRQANCRAAPHSRQVKIQDSSGDKRATYCQRAPGTTDKSR